MNWAMRERGIGGSGAAVLVAAALLMWAMPETVRAEPPPPGGNAICPVDGDAAKARFAVEHEGQTVYLCCGRCARTFRQDPAHYVALAADLPRVEDADADQQPDTDADDQPRADGDDHAHDHHDDAHDDAHDDEVAHAPGHDHDHNGHDAAHVHDHAHEGPITSFLHWLGHFHVVTVHFPLGLLLAGAVGELVWLATRRRWVRDGVRFCIWAGMLGTLITVPLGWLLLGGDTQHDDAITAGHRWMGTLMFFWVIALVVVMERARRVHRRGWRWAYRFLLFAGAVALGVTGHLGGMLVHGEGYLSW